jgi:hypothetical protein
MLMTLAIVIAIALFWSGALWHRWYQDDESVNAPLDFLLTALLTARDRTVHWFSRPRPTPLPPPIPAPGAGGPATPTS